MTTEELLQIMIDNQTTIIGQNETMITNQQTMVLTEMQLAQQNSMLLSLVIVAIVMVFWFKRRRTKWM